MKLSNYVFAAVGILSPLVTSAIELNPDDPGARLASLFELV
jgi:hypothetical protein